MIELCGWGLHSHTEPLIGLPRSYAPCNSQVSQRVKEISLTWPPLGSLRVPRPHQGRQSTLTPLHRGQGTCSTAVSPAGTACPHVCKPGCLFTTPTFSAQGQSGNTAAENGQQNCYCRENGNTWAFRRTYTCPEEPKPSSLSSPLTFSPRSLIITAVLPPCSHHRHVVLWTANTSRQPVPGGQLIACPAFLQCSHCSAHHNHFCNTTDSWCLCQAVTTAPMARDLLACYRSTHAAHPPLHLPALTVSQLGIHPASGTFRCSPALGENNTAHLAAMQRLDLKTHLVSDSPLQPLTTVLESFPTPLLDPLPHSTLDSPHPIPCYPSTLPSGCPSLFPGPGSWQVGLALLFVGTDPFCSSCRVRCLAHGSS